jgi:hypothetical protein
VNLSFDGVIGVQGEISLAPTMKQPVSVQLFWKNWSSYNSNWGVSGFGAAGIYDFTKIANLDRKFHPYAGLGLVAVQSSWKGNGVQGLSPVSGGLYATAGVRYDLTPKLDLDGSLNTFGGLTVGINLLF